MPKDRVYRYNQDASSFNLEFYEAYDDRFLINKARSLMVIAERLGAFKDLAQDSYVREAELDQGFVDALRAEVHFTAFHQFECLFALLTAIYQDHPHWVYLTTYRNDELDSKIESFLAGDISALTGGVDTEKTNFVQNSVYAGFQPSKGSQEAELWTTNLESLHWLLRRMATKFTGAEYNAYKHGLRVKTGGNSITFTPLDVNMEPLEATAPAFHVASKDAISYLVLSDRIETDQSISFAVHETHLHFDAYESLIYLENMAKVVRMIKVTRLARVTGTIPDTLCLFDHIDRDAMTNLSPQLLRFTRPR